MATKCEGYHRRGGAFTLGPVVWEQCENAATVNLTIRDKRETKTLPACDQCWQKVIDSGLEIIEAKPIGGKHG